MKDIFAKLGLLLEGKINEAEIKGKKTYEINDLELASGFKKAKETREFMGKVRTSSMFSEFKYEVLIDKLVHEIADFVLLTRKNYKDLGELRSLRKEIVDARGDKEKIKKLEELDKKLKNLGLSKIKENLEAKCQEIFGANEKGEILYLRGGFSGRKWKSFQFCVYRKEWTLH